MEFEKHVVLRSNDEKLIRSFSVTISNKMKNDLWILSSKKNVNVPDSVRKFLQYLIDQHLKDQ